MLEEALLPRVAPGSSRKATAAQVDCESEATSVTICGDVELRGVTVLPGGEIRSERSSVTMRSWISATEVAVKERHMKEATPGTLMNWAG